MLQIILLAVTKCVLVLRSSPAIVSARLTRELPQNFLYASRPMTSALRPAHYDLSVSFQVENGIRPKPTHLPNQPTEPWTGSSDELR
jgi:hypothetical protein